MKDTIFTEPVMRPPQESGSLLVPATQGCTYNKCHFCYVSREYPFMAATPEQFETCLLSEKKRFAPDTRIYLTGSNPFALPLKTLETYLQILHKHMPLFRGASMQTRVQDVRNKDSEELSALRKLRLDLVYMGVESGSDAALALMNKGNTAAEAIEQMHRLNKAGIGFNAFYVLGMGGKGQGQASARATAAMFNEVKPYRITTTGMTVFPGTPLTDMVKTGEYVEASEKEKIEELLIFLELLAVDVRFEAVHYLNPLQYKFSNEEGKKLVISDIKACLKEYGEEELELMVSRHLMQSL